MFQTLRKVRTTRSHGLQICITCTEKGVVSEESAGNISEHHSKNTLFLSLKKRALWWKCFTKTEKNASNTLRETWDRRHCLQLHFLVCGELFFISRRQDFFVLVVQGQREKESLPKLLKMLQPLLCDICPRSGWPNIYYLNYNIWMKKWMHDKNYWLGMQMRTFLSFHKQTFFYVSDN